MRGLGQVIEHCKIAALWSSYDMDTEEPLDQDHDIFDFAPEADAVIHYMCQAFMQRAANLLDTYPMGWAQLGHDIWLTVNGHGVGFMDRAELSAGLARRLTIIAEDLPELELYVGDDDKIYIS